MDELAECYRHAGVELVHGLHEKILVELIAHGIFWVAAGKWLAMGEQLVGCDAPSINVHAMIDGLPL